MKKPPFQQIEATMLDAQGAVSFQHPTPPRGGQLDSSTSIDQHLQGYDRFNLRIPFTKMHKILFVYVSYMNKSPNTPPNRTNHKKLSCFIQFVQLPQQNFIIKKPNQNHFFDNTNTYIFSPNDSHLFCYQPLDPPPMGKFWCNNPTSKSHSGFTSMHWATVLLSHDGATLRSVAWKI